MSRRLFVFLQLDSGGRCDAGSLSSDHPAAQRRVQRVPVLHSSVLALVSVSSNRPSGCLSVKFSTLERAVPLFVFCQFCTLAPFGLVLPFRLLLLRHALGTAFPHTAILASLSRG